MNRSSLAIRFGTGDALLEGKFFAEGENMEKQRSAKRFYTPREAADIFGFAEGTLANLRTKRQGCKYYKRGRKVLYDADEFEGWIKSNPVLTKHSLAE